MIWSLFFHAKWLSRLGLFDVLKSVLLNVLEVHSLPVVLKVLFPYVLELVLSVSRKVFLPDVLKVVPEKLDSERVLLVEGLVQSLGQPRQHLVQHLGRRRRTGLKLHQTQSTGRYQALYNQNN